MNTQQPSTEVIVSLPDLLVEEWFKDCQRVRPGLSWEEFLPIWNQFQQNKLNKLKQRKDFR